MALEASGCGSRALLLFKPEADFIIISKLAPVCLCHAFLDGGAEPDSFFHQAQSGIFHQMLGIETSVGGDLRKLGFLLRGEMYFHVLRLEILLSCVN